MFVIFIYLLYKCTSIRLNPLKNTANMVIIAINCRISDWALYFQDALY